MLGFASIDYAWTRIYSGKALDSRPMALPNCKAVAALLQNLLDVLDGQNRI